jgi:hypothetical protein
VQHTHAARIGERIEFVVKDGFTNNLAIAIIDAKEEGAGFVPSATAPFELSNDFAPELRRAPQPVATPLDILA